MITGFGLLILLAGAGRSLLSQTNTPRFEPVKVISATEAVYPANVVNPGTIVLDVMVGTEGKIEEVKVARAMPPFTEEALKAIQRWEFAPAHLDGEPVRSIIPVVFSFSRPTVWWPQPDKLGSGVNR
jgi:TonB family protein